VTRVSSCRKKPDAPRTFAAPSLSKKTMYWAARAAVACPLTSPLQQVSPPLRASCQERFGHRVLRRREGGAGTESVSFVAAARSM
jgi:hypothetical protein